MIGTTRQNSKIFDPHAYSFTLNALAGGLNSIHVFNTLPHVVSPPFSRSKRMSKNSEAPVFVSKPGLPRRSKAKAGIHPRRFRFELSLN